MLATVMAYAVVWQLCKVLKADGYDVVATCRKTSPELDALAVKVVQGTLEAAASSGYFSLQPVMMTQHVVLCLNDMTAWKCLLVLS